MAHTCSACDITMFEMSTTASMMLLRASVIDLSVAAAVPSAVEA